MQIILENKGEAGGDDRIEAILAALQHLPHQFLFLALRPALCAAHQRVRLQGKLSQAAEVEGDPAHLVRFPPICIGNCSCDLDHLCQMLLPKHFRQFSQFGGNRLGLERGVGVGVEFAVELAVDLL